MLIFTISKHKISKVTMFLVCLVINAEKPFSRGQYHTEFQSTDYSVIGEKIKKINKKYFEPIRFNNSYTADTNLRYNHINISTKFNNVKEVSFVFMGDAYDSEHVAFQGRHIDDDYPKNHSKHSKYYDDIIWKYDGTASISVALGKDYSKLEKPSFSYYWAKTDDPQLALSRFLNKKAANYIKNKKPDLFVITSKHVKYALDERDISDLKMKNETMKYNKIPQFDKFVEIITKNQSTTILMAAGDYGSIPLDAQELAFAYHPHVFIIGATSFSSGAAWYSQWSDCLFACAPGGGTDVVTGGPGQYLPGIKAASPNNTFPFAIGTNIATSVFASLAAIVAKRFKRAGLRMKSRDLLYLTALTADIVDPNHALWQKNGAGIYFNPAFGYGQINIGKIVKIIDVKENRENLTKLIGNEIKVTKRNLDYLTQKNIDHYIEFGAESGSEFIFFFDDEYMNNRVETISFIFSLYDYTSSDLYVTVTSPSNTTHIIKNFGVGNDFFKKNDTRNPQPHNRFVFMSRMFFGENLYGNWTVKAKFKTFTPMNQIWGTHFQVTCADTNASLKEYLQQENFTYVTPYVYENNSSMIFDKDSVQCMDNYTVQFNANAFSGAENESEDDNQIYLSFYLRHPGSHRLFKLENNDFNMTIDDIKNNHIMNYTFRVPCLLESGNEVILGASHFMLNRSVETKPFKVMNDYPKYTIYNQKTYDLFTDKVVDFQFAFNESELPGLGKTQALHAAIFNITTLQVVYSWTFTNYGHLTIDFTKLDQLFIPHGVLTITQYNSTKDCPSIYYPFRFIRSDVFMNKYDGKVPSHPFNLSMRLPKIKPECLNNQKLDPQYQIYFDDQRARDYFVNILAQDNLFIVGVVYQFLILFSIIIIFAFVRVMIVTQNKSTENESSSSTNVAKK